MISIVPRGQEPSMTSIVTEDVKMILEINTNSPVKSPFKKKKRLSVERIYQKKTQLEHILLRPDTYIGSVEPNSESMWVYDEVTSSIVNRTITFVPGLYKIFDEILVNAADNKQRDPNMSTIKINIDPEKNKISVWNDGRGIPVEMHKEQKVYVPTLIFGHLLTSSNYDDNQKKTTGGRNGYGAKLCNIFSTEFVVETSSKESGKHFKQKWSKNMSKTDEPKIKDATGKDFTCISFKPDLAKFKMESLDSDTVALLTRRAYDIAGVARGVTVFLNGEKIKVKNFKEYVDLYLKSTANEEEYTDDDKKPKVVHEIINKRWEVCVTVSHKGFQQASFVNSIATTKGGTHVNYVTDQITEKLLVLVKKKQSKGGVKIKPFQIKTHLWMFINCLIENPSFDSQTKENMTLRAKDFGSACDLSDKFIKLVQNCGVMNNIMNWVKFKAQSQLNQKCHSSKHSKLKGIPKLDDANNAGTKHSGSCTLILTEGDSAKTLAVSGLSVVGRDNYGVFPLRGKLLNVRDASHKQILENQEINNIIKILGLQYNKKYKNIDDLKSLRYGKLMIMTDQDQDGSHIKGLLLNFIHTNWPSLLRLPFLEQFITPIVKVIKGKQELSFYSMPEFEEWLGNTESSKSWRVKYYKGLGTSTPKEAKEYFADMKRHRIRFTYEGNIDDEAIEMAFSKKKVSERKDWLTCGLEERKLRRLAGMPEMYLYEKDTTQVSYNGFINKELILFSNADNERSIPSLVDGLKPGQRKVLFTCLKRNDKREIKVAQLAGSVAELSAYHHGETSLMSTIINLAQNFVGSNNINILQPIGQFGTRLHGGKDAASPRYIFTKLSPLARLIFPLHDDYSLKFLMDDNQKIEPEWYCPILPMVLVNGADGIGTGYSTKVPNFDPRDIVESLKQMIRGEDPSELMPSYKNFTGTVTQVEAQKFSVKGVVNVVDTTTIEIDDLPIGVWTQNYKENVLEPMLHGTEKVSPCITDYKEYHTDTTVRFVIIMTEEKLAEAEQLGLHRKFKLETNCNTSNMVLFDQHGCLRKYESTSDIVKDFFELRLERYCIRKAYLEAMLQAEASKLENQARFILEKIEGTIVIENRTKRDLITMLVTRGYASDPVKSWKDSLKTEGTVEEGEDDASSVASSSESTGGPDFHYLLGMALWSLSKEKKDELLKQRDEKKEELESLKKKTPQDMWLADLDIFLVELEKLEQQEREDEENAVKPKAGRSQKSVKPKPRKQTTVKGAFKPVTKEDQKAAAAKENKPEIALNAEKEISKKKPAKSSKDKEAKEALETIKKHWDIEDEDEEEKPMMTLMDRLAVKNRSQSVSSVKSVTSSNSDSSGASSTSKKQSTMDAFTGKGTSVTANKKNKKESSDDEEENMIVDFSDGDESPPLVRRQTDRRAAAAKNQNKYVLSSDEDSFEIKGSSKDHSFVISDNDDDDDFEVGKKKAKKQQKTMKKKAAAVLEDDSDSESEKSDVLATRALIERLTPTKKKLPKEPLQSSSQTSDADSIASVEVKAVVKPQKKQASKKSAVGSKRGKKADTAQPTIAETLSKSVEKRKNEPLPAQSKKTKQTSSSESDEKMKAGPSRKRKGAVSGKGTKKVTEIGSDSDGSVVIASNKKGKQQKPKKSPPKRKKMLISSDEEVDHQDDEEEPIPRPARQRRARAPTKYNFGDDSEDEQGEAGGKDDSNDWLASDDDDDSDF